MEKIKEKLKRELFLTEQNKEQNRKMYARSGGNPDGYKPIVQVNFTIEEASQILAALEGPSEEEMRQACIDFVDNNVEVGINMDGLGLSDPEEYDYHIWKAAIDWAKNRN